MATTRIVGPLSRAAPHRRSFGGVAGEIGAVTLLLLCLRFAPASANEIPTIGDLKRLNVEDLMNVEVTSVSRHPEKLIETASAIQVITQADIRRSGATSIAEALRLADNLQVAQKNSQNATRRRAFCLRARFRPQTYHR
jgi:ribosomal protein S13